MNKLKIYLTVIFIKTICMPSKTKNKDSLL